MILEQTLIWTNFYDPVQQLVARSQNGSILGSLYLNKMFPSFTGVWKPGYHVSGVVDPR